MKKISLILIIFISFIFTGCVENIYETNKKKNEKNIEIEESKNNTKNKIKNEKYGIEEKSEIENIGEKDFKKVFQGIKKEYKQDNKFNVCMNYAVGNCLGEAIRKDSFEKLDETICNNLLDSYSKENCKDNVFDLKASKTQEVHYCNEIGNDYMKNNCRYKFFRSKALEKKDISICKQIIKSNNKKDKSSTGIVILESNFIYLVDECINNISLELSVSLNDKKYCNDITDQYLMNQCKNPSNINENIPNANDIIVEGKLESFITPPAGESSGTPADIILE